MCIRDRDIAFHTCVAECAKNKVVEQLIPVIDTAVLMFVNVTHKKLCLLYTSIRQNRDDAVTGQERVLQLQEALKAWMDADQTSFFEECERELTEYISGQRSTRTARLQEKCQAALDKAAEEGRNAKDALVSARSEYLRRYVNQMCIRDRFLCFEIP